MINPTRAAVDSVVLVAVLLWFAILLAGTLQQDPDGDTAQHLSTARAVAERGSYEGVVPGLVRGDSWAAIHYPGLFYVIAGSAWALGGELAARLLGPIFAACAALGVYAAARGAGHALAGVVAVAFLISSEDAYLLTVQPFLEPLVLLSCALALVALGWYLAAPCWRHGVALGVAVGVAVATKQQGWFLAGGVAIVLILGAVSARPRLPWLTGAAGAIVASTITAAPYLFLYVTRRFTAANFSDPTYRIWRDFLLDPAGFVLPSGPGAISLAVLGVTAGSALVAWSVRRWPVPGGLLAAAAFSALLALPARLFTRFYQPRYWVPSLLLATFAGALLVTLFLSQLPVKRSFPRWATILTAGLLLLPSLLVAAHLPAQHALDEDVAPPYAGRLAAVKAAGEWVNGALPPDARLLASRYNEVLYYANRATVENVPRTTSPAELADALAERRITHAWIDSTRVGENTADSMPLDIVRFLYAPGASTVLHRNAFIDILKIHHEGVRAVPANLTYSDDLAPRPGFWPVRLEPPERWQSAAHGWRPAGDGMPYVHVVTSRRASTAAVVGLSYVDGVGSWSIDARAESGEYLRVAEIKGSGTSTERIAWFPIPSGLLRLNPAAEPYAELSFRAEGDLLLRAVASVRGASTYAQAEASHGWLVNKTGRPLPAVSGDALAQGRGPALPAESSARIVTTEPAAAAFGCGCKTIDARGMGGREVLAANTTGAAHRRLAAFGATHVLIDPEAIGTPEGAPVGGLLGPLSLPGVVDIEHVIGAHQLLRVDLVRLASFPLPEVVVAAGIPGMSLSVLFDPADRWSITTSRARLDVGSTGYWLVPLPRGAPGPHTLLLAGFGEATILPRGGDAVTVSGSDAVIVPYVAPVELRGGHRLDFAIMPEDSALDVRAVAVLRGSTATSAAAETLAWLIED